MKDNLYNFILLKDLVTQYQIKNCLKMQLDFKSRKAF